MILNNNKKEHNKEVQKLKLKINNININENEKESKGTNKKIIKKGSKSYDEGKAIKNSYTFNKEINQNKDIQNSSENIIEEKNKELYKLESEIEQLTEKLTNRLISGEEKTNEDEEKKIFNKLNEKKAEKEILSAEIKNISFASALPPANKEKIVNSISVKEKHKNIKKFDKC